MVRQAVYVDDEGTIDIPHLGITLRVLLAAAAENAIEGKRQYPVRYKNVVIAKVRIKGTQNVAQTV